MAIPLTRRLAFSEIPQIDASPFFAEDVAEVAAAKLARACEEVGFFYVTKKNPRNSTEKMEFRKYDPVVRKHVLFKESKIK